MKFLFIDKVKESNYCIDYERTESVLGISETVIKTLPYKSEKKLYFKCKRCGIQINRCLKCSDIFRHKKFAECQVCGSSTSYPERLLYMVLKNVGIEGEKIIFDWSERREYDIWIKKYNTIIECHGEQHYYQSTRKGCRTLEEEIENDKYKKDIALKNGIERYIVIDCRVSDLEFIKNNILNSELAKMFNFTNVDWEECNRKCYEYSNVKLICDYWNSLEVGNRSPIDIVGKYGIRDRSTIRKYLKIGNKIGWCEYNTSEMDAYRLRKIGEVGKGNKYICNLDGVENVFSSIPKVAKFYKIGITTVRKIIEEGTPYNQNYKKTNHIIGLTIINQSR